MSGSESEAVDARLDGPRVAMLRCVKVEGVRVIYERNIGLFKEIEAQIVLELLVREEVQVW